MVAQEMQAKLLIILAAIAMWISPSAMAQVPALEAAQAQAKMIERVDRSVDKFLKTYKLNGIYGVYCRIQMDLDTNDAPSGLIPFGVDYSTIPDRKTLDLIIYNRESYETAYMKLCLSKAITTLDSVNSFEKFDGLEK